MNKKYLFLLALTFFFATGHSQWQQTNGIEGGIGNAGFNVGNTLFLGTSNNDNSVYTSTDNGNSWTRILNGVPSGISTFTQLNSTLYFCYESTANDSGGIYYSNDTGATWSELQTVQIPYLKKIRSHNNNLYAISISGLYRSANGGSSWQQLALPYSNYYPVDFCSIGNVIFIAFPLPGGTEVWSSSNDGNTWSLTTGTNLPGTGSVSHFLAGGSDLFILLSGNGIYKSSNNGSSWSSLPSVSADRLFYSNGCLVYTNNGGTNMYYSLNQGTSFTNFNVNHPINDIVYLNNELLMMCHESACVKIDQFGGYLESNDGIIASGIPKLWGNKSNKVETYIRYVGAYSSSDEGQTWQTTNRNFEKVYQNNNYVYGTDSYTFAYQFSKDNGNTYRYVPGILLPSNYVRGIAGSNDTVYIASANGLYSSLDTGLTFNLLYNSFNSPDVQDVKPKGNKIYACTELNVYVSQNYGSSWTIINTGLSPTLKKEKLFVLNGNVYLIAHNNIYTASFLFRLNESTNTWVNCTPGLPVARFYDLITRQNQLMIATGNGIFLSINNGATWNDISQGLTDQLTYSLYADSTNVYAGTSSAGVWVRSLNDAIFVPSVTLISDAINDSACAGQTITFTAGGAAQFQFYLNGNPAGSLSANNIFNGSSFQNGDSISVIGYGFAGGTDTATIVLNIINSAPPVISLQSNVNSTRVCPNTSFTFTASGGINYEFNVAGINQGSTSNSAINYVATGNFNVYVTGYDSNNCHSTSTTLNYQVYSNPAPPQPSICMVTVDSLSTHNIIYWDKTGFTYVDSFRIYREDVTNVYSHIGSVAFNDTSEYHDYAANPNVTTKRYKLSAIDSCGNESPLSNYHNTIYVTSSGNGQYNWNLYVIENSANPVANFLLMRDDNSTGNFQQIGSTAGNQNVLNDPNYALYPNGSWRIHTSWSISCDPSRGAINTSRSNIKITSTNAITKPEQEFLLRVYPNPFAEQFIIETVLSSDKPMFELVNTYGQKVIETSLTDYKTTISTLELAAGVYYYRLRTSSKTQTGKLIRK
jgi:hypothetical protein